MNALMAEILEGHVRLHLCQPDHAKDERRAIAAEKTLRAFAEEVSGKQIAARSLRSFCAEWLEEKQPSASLSTYKYYRKAVEKIISYFGEVRAEEPIGAISRADLIGLRNTLAKEVSSCTVNHDLIAIKAIFRTARQGAISPKIRQS